MFELDTQQTAFPETESAQIEELHRILRQGQAILTSPDGLHQLTLPDPLYRLLLRILSQISKGKSITCTPETQQLTTQEAANFLGMSRQFLVGLLDRGEIPYHRVGTHRRVILRDVLAYRKQRDQRRHQAIDQMAKEAIDAGIYDEF